MSSIWSLNGADIYVDKYSPERKSQTAELNPINSTSSTLHYIYTPSDTISISGIVIGDTDLATIQDGAGGNVTLVTDQDPGGSTVFLASVNAERMQSWRQNIDTTKDSDAPVYRVNCVVRS